MLSASPEHVYVYDMMGRYLYASPAACAALGLEQTDIIGKSWRELGFPAAIMERIDAQREHVFQTGHSVVSEVAFAVVDGLRNYEYVISPVRDSKGSIVHAVCISRDITERRRMEQTLRESERLHRAVTEGVSDALFVIEPVNDDFRVVYINPVITAHSGMTHKHTVGRTVRELVPPSAAQAMYARYAEAIAARRMIEYEEDVVIPAGPITVATRLTPVFNAQGQCERLVGASHDVTKHKRAEQALAEANRTLVEINARLEAQIALSHAQAVALERQKAELQTANTRLEALATTDGLTDIKNHRAFQERLVSEVERSVRYGESLSLLLIDVDRFKPFNDTFGHPAGDNALRIVAHILQNCARAADFVARYGGEEFVVILPEADAPGALEAAERFRAAVESHAWEQRAITVSVGIATLQSGRDTPQTLIDHADRALYHAKQSGRNCISHAERTESTTLFQ